MLHTVLAGHLLPPGAVVAVGASGGKDSTVLAHVLRELAPRLGITLHLVAVDEGIGGYRDAALEAVRSQAARWELPLTIVAYEDLFGGWTMDAVARSTAGSGRSRSCCTFCSLPRRRRWCCMRTSAISATFPRSACMPLRPSVVMPGTCLSSWRRPDHQPCWTSCTRQSA